jgi:hypothetical protein
MVRQVPQTQIILIWIARILIGLVIFFNLESAFVFLLNPQDYVSGFGLQGDTGNLAIRGIGLLFVMWNIPYLVAFAHPAIHRISLLEAIAMQAIGLIGETILCLSLSPELAAVQNSLTRFIGFDGAGLISLLFAFACIRYKKGTT